MMPITPTPGRLLLWHVRALAASQYASRHDIPGMEFNRFGRKMGWRLLIRGLVLGAQYVLAPVNIVRYFEFPFCLSCIPEKPELCLDVSSPRLFSLYLASRPSPPRIRMINPSRRDVTTTSLIARRLGIRNLGTSCAGVDVLAGENDHYDGVWSISVLEHIHGQYDDRYAVKLMHEHLKPGGRLIVTVPVDRSFREEYRERDEYGGQKEAKGAFFFQRVYDEEAIASRLLAPIGARATVSRWFGETCRGVFAEYERRWLRNGLECIVDDPREIADHYKEYSSWEEMPGFGVCGLMIEKAQ